MNLAFKRMREKMSLKLLEAMNGINSNLPLFHHVTNNTLVLQNPPFLLHNALCDVEKQ
jgi:hypothetical protein